jgi:hypothetical protein
MSDTKEYPMPKKPIDLDRIRQADERLDRLLEEHPELTKPNPERQQALEEWRQEHLQEDKSHDRDTDN